MCVCAVTPLASVLLYEPYFSHLLFGESAVSRTGFLGLWLVVKRSLENVMCD